MQLSERNGIGLAYEEMNSGAPPIILVHGWSCDHTVFARQSEFLRQTHHVVLVDLRGHGESDAPHQDYTMVAFADDLAWLCTELALVKPIVVGHSMGGNVALELRCVGRQCCPHASPQTMKHGKGCSSLPCRGPRSMF